MLAGPKHTSPFTPHRELLSRLSNVLVFFLQIVPHVLQYIHMSQAVVSLPKSVFENLVERISMLEKAVFDKTDLPAALSIYLSEKKAGKLKKLKKTEDLFV